MNSNKKPFLVKLFKFTELIFAPKLISGAVNEVKQPAQILKDNVKDLTKIVKNKISHNDSENEEYIEYDGKEHFHKMMEEQRVTPEIYNKELNKRYIQHWFYLVGYVASFFWLFHLFFAAREYTTSSIFFIVITVIYLKFSKETAELREQEFLSFKKFINIPNALFPTKVRQNDYFEIDIDKIAKEEAQLEKMLNDENLAEDQEDMKQFREWQAFKRMKELEKQTQEQD